MVLKFQGIHVCTAKGILILEESQMNSKTRKPAVHNLSELKCPNYKKAHAGGYSVANSTMTNSGHVVLAFLYCFLIADWRRKIA
jgi:hypothetical protein